VIPVTPEPSLGDEFCSSKNGSAFVDPLPNKTIFSDVDSRAKK